MSTKLTYSEIKRFAPDFDQLCPEEQRLTIDRLQHDSKVRGTLHQEADDEFEAIMANNDTGFFDWCKAGINRVKAEWRLGV